MSGLRVLIMLFVLLSGGLAHASYSSFDDAPRASDEVLDQMRGGFVVSWNGLEFLMPFSIDGIERLTQINGQTYINGELMTAALNPRALTPFSQTGPVTVNMQTPVPVAANTGLSEDVTVLVKQPLAQTASGSGVTSSGSGDAGAGSASDSAGVGTTNTGTGAASGTTTSSGNSGTQVTTNGSWIIVQNGVANTVVLPANGSLDSLATFIQNSVNNQVIRNITTLNLTVEAQRLALQARLNSIHNQSLNGLR
jgi:hypothetical protein